MTATYEPVCSSRDRKAWLAARRTGIGSSDAAAILGISPYGSALSVYTEKIGAAPETSETEAMKWGRKLEPLVIAGFAEETDRGCEPNNALLRSKACPYHIATPDAMQVRRDRPMDMGILEVKTTGFGRESWDEGLPPYVNAQVQHQLLVTGYDWGSAAVLVSGQKLLWVDVERDNRFIDEILRPAEEDFWKRVEERMPPPADGSLHAEIALKLLYPKHEPGKVVQLGGEFIDLDFELCQLQEEVKEREERISGIKQRFKEALQDAESGVISGGVTYTYKVQHRKETIQPASDFRVLRRSSK